MFLSLSISYVFLLGLIRMKTLVVLSSRDQRYHPFEAFDRMIVRSYVDETQPCGHSVKQDEVTSSRSSSDTRFFYFLLNDLVIFDYSFPNVNGILRSTVTKSSIAAVGRSCYFWLTDLVISIVIA